MPKLVHDEEIIGASILQRDYKSVLDRAAEHPVSIRREKGDDMTIVSRRRWLDAWAALELQDLTSTLSLSIAELLAGKQPRYPAELTWLEEFDNEDVLEFANEYFHALRDASRGLASWSAVHDLLHQWELSAAVLRDEELKTRIQSVLRHRT